MHHGYSHHDHEDCWNECMLEVNGKIRIIEIMLKLFVSIHRILDMNKCHTEITPTTSLANDWLQHVRGDHIDDRELVEAL